MYSFQTWVNIPADRRITITVPPSVPVGPAEVQLSLTWPPPDADAVDGGPTADPKFNREWFAFYEMLPELLKTHRGQYVAIHEGRVVASGANRLQVGDEAQRQFGDVSILVQLVSERPEVRHITSVWHVRGAGR
jgi:hypothetical protein